MDLSGVLIQVSILAIPLLCAITLHEVAHGWVARLHGDRTAEAQGRLSLNPLRHVDPVGTVLLPAAQLLLLHGVYFGWAKPVPVNPRFLRHPRTDMAKVAAAGPGANLLMAIFWALVMMLAARVALPGSANDWLAAMGRAGIQINILLAAFNLLPIPPLDGGKVLAGVLPAGSLRSGLERLEPYGFMIVLLLIVTDRYTHILSIVLWPLAALIQLIVRAVTGNL